MNIPPRWLNRWRGFLLRGRLARMDSKVVPLRAGPVATGAAHPDVIELLERLLAEAQRGEITGIAVAHVDGGDMLMTNWAQGNSTVSRLVGVAALLQYRIAKTWDQS